jgi:hypothetical protein
MAPTLRFGRWKPGAGAGFGANGGTLGGAGKSVPV